VCENGGSARTFGEDGSDGSEGWESISAMKMVVKGVE